MKVLISLLLFVLISCEADPYPELTGDQDLRRRPRVDTEPPPPAMSASIPSVVYLKEGSKFKHSLRVSVPDPGQPLITVDDLPAGAVFDAETRTISWLPSFFDGNDLKDPTIRNRRYEITIWLRSTHLDPSETIKSKMILDVEDVPQAFNINARDSQSVREGGTLSYEFTISNLDYPQGPFSVFGDSLPNNSKIEKINDTKYRIVFTPDYHHVKLNNNTNPCDSWNKECFKYESQIVVTNPAGHQTKKDIEIEVNDVRQDVSLAVPENTQQGLDISFSVSSVDPNAEVAPNILLDGKEPEVGEFSTKLKKDEENNFSTLNVSWKDIPPVYNGKTITFNFKSCVLNSRSQMNSCDRNSFSVTIVVKNRNAPVFYRKDWEVGEIKFLRHNERDNYRVIARDGDTSRELQKIEVFPESMRKHVSYRGGYIYAQFDKPGIHQFSLVATSDYNLSSAESFVVDVFDKDRANTLFFVDSTRTDEVRFYKNVLGNVELFNPVIQTLNTKVLSGRDTVILGTEILYDTSMEKVIDNAITMIPNVLIATPLLENMPTKFIDKLQKEYRVSITGRYSDIQGAPKLSDMHFVARDDFEVSKDKIGLKLNSTGESSDPLIFSVGVDRKNCQDVMDFTNNGKESLFKIGVICDRDTGGRLAILGTEFSDLKTTEDDKQVPAKWLRSMLSVDLDGDK